MSKRRTNKTKYQARAQSPLSSQAHSPIPEGLKVAGMTITWHPIRDPSVDQLPRDVKDSIQKLHAMVNSNPSAALPVARAMAIKYPDVLCLRNWIETCYTLLGDTAMANQEREALFRDHPDYLFARLATVEAMLQRGDFDKAEAVLFEKGRTLREIYPARTVFHVTEANNWLAICGRLAAMQLRFDEARAYRDWLNELEPNSPQVKMMDRLLSEEGVASLSVLNTLRKGLERFAGTAHKRKPRAATANKKPRVPDQEERQAEPPPEAAPDQLELF